MNINTVQCENTSAASKDEVEIITYESQNSAQMKLIKDLQESVKLLHSSQQQLITHIQSFEDTVIELSNSENESVSCNRAKQNSKKD